MATTEEKRPIGPAAPAERREEYKSVIRYYELAKRAEWQVRDLPWSELPPIPESRARRRSRRAAATSGAP